MDGYIDAYTSLFQYIDLETFLIAVQHCLLYDRLKLTQGVVFLYY